MPTLRILLAGEEAATRRASEIVNRVRACDYFPFPSPWGHPESKIGRRQFGIIKARLTGQACAAAPGFVGQSDAAGGEMACGDEWIRCEKLWVGGRPVPPAEVLRRGDRLEDG